MNRLAESTAALHAYLQRNDRVNGFAEDQARMLARDAAIPVDAAGFPSVARKAEVIVSRIHDTFHYAEKSGFFDRSETFRCLWDEVIVSAIEEGYPVA